MGFKDYLKNIFGVTEPPVKKRKSRLSDTLRKQPNDRIRMEMDTLNRAVEDALDPYNSDRSTLLDIYEKTVVDSQYISEHEKAESFLITEPFDVCPIGTTERDEDKTLLFSRPWFPMFLRYCLEEEMWGYTLLEFGQQDSNGEFIDVSIFPRHHVRPVEKVITKYPDSFDGVSYAGKETEYFLLPLGSAGRLGKLRSIAIEVIWKNFARSDWSEYNERFGKPFVVYKTESDNDAERDKAFEMAQKFGSDLVGVVDPEDELEVISASGKESPESYSALAKACDEYISKMVNGQTGTSDVKAWAGSAEVHERILTEFTKARMIRIQNVINYELFPFLIAHGYDLEGYQFQFYGLRSEEENTVDNKSYDEPDPSKTNKDGLGFFA